MRASHEKIVPDPPHHFDLPEDTSLTHAICDNLVPLDHVVVNITHYLMIAYNHSHRALDGIEDERTRETLVNGLRAMQLA